MVTLLDVTLSVITGMIVILTIIFSIININQMSYNLETMLALHEFCTNTSDSGENVIEILETYLEYAGRHMADPDSQRVFHIAESNRLRFRAKEESFSPTPDMYEFRYGTGNGLPRLEVLKNGNEVFRTWPYALREPVFTYFNYDGNPINPTTDAQRAAIRSVRVDLIFEAPGWGKQDDLVIGYPITFWQYFKNLYIRNAPTGP